MTASTSHPDLLGGWEAWAEAPAPAAAAEGTSPAPWRRVLEQASARAWRACVCVSCVTCQGSHCRRSVGCEGSPVLWFVCATAGSQGQALPSPLGSAPGGSAVEGLCAVCPGVLLSDVFARGQPPA